MREWEKLGDEYACMLDYVFIPPISKKTNDIGKHKNGYRNLCFLHLFGRGINSKELKDKLNERKDRLPVAIHHFKPCVREALGRSKAERKEAEQFRCSIDEGIQAGFTNLDLCTTQSKNGDQIYYLVPNNNFEDIIHELSQAQICHRIKQSALAASTSTSSKKQKILDGEIGAIIPRNPSQAIGPIEMKMREKYNQHQQASSSSTAKKRSPAEREFDNRVKEVQANPHKAILDIDE